MEKDTKETLHVIVGMIEELGKKLDGVENKVDRLEVKVDGLEAKVDRIEGEMQEVKIEQQKMNQKLDVLSSVYGRHDVAIQLLEKKKII
ncbi:hypothetical protein SAMN05446037_10492 [Anaerovirgula multivorans]|uniref:Uncharacterized protein n=1 Tax=Anaerovirgula multivorans TaxID=312168 RepID=A0A239KL19_9FIRM|nr:hypothetical protein [Anaerovirgula multivorans]SNT18388.1 hypothetical protein SAMN05446037_10492 [Anaerovirgula multivorans]